MNCHYHPEVTATAFCQFCGKPLCKDCVHNVAGAVYCEACLAERLRVAAPPTGIAGSFSTGTPHPLLAAVLGCIPGVGAMYNGQFPKAIAHVVIFAVLVSMTNLADVFGLLVAAWVFYQIFDAYQTAIARRDGLPLPNPFGLNDIAQRMGILPGAGAPPVPPVQPPPYAPSGWEPGAPGSNPGAASFVPPAADPYAGQRGYAQPGYTPVAPPMAGQPYSMVPGAQRDLPIGALLLIGLGLLFLLISLGLVHGRVVAHSWPLLIIGLGVWVMVRRTRDVAPGPGAGPSGGVQ